MSIAVALRKRLRTKPYPYQSDGVEFAEDNEGRAIIADDMGLGKTLQLIGYVALHPRMRPIICVVPSSVKYHWKRELKKHAGLKCEVLEGRTPYRARRNILILNYEILQYWLDVLIDLNPQCLIIDECHYIKNKDAKVTQCCMRLATVCKHRLLSSGTPIDNRPAEFWPALHIVAPKAFPVFLDYAFQFCAPRKGFRGQWDFSGASNLKRLHRKVKPYMIRRLKKHVLKDLPQKRRVVIPVDIDNRKAYEKARDNFIEYLEQTEGIKAVQRAKGALTLVRLGKLKRLAAQGKLKTAINWIEDWLTETDKKLVVFAIHRDILDALKARFPFAAYVSGKTPPRKRQDEVDRFRFTKKCRLFFGQLKAAGTGVDGLQRACSNTLTLEIAWNDAKHQQAEDRVLRIGQKQSCENYYLVGEDTIEEWLLEVVHKKQIAIDQILEGKIVQGKTSLLRMLERLG